MTANASNELFHFRDKGQQQRQEADAGDPADDDRCPRCAARVHPSADICELCGEWLLTGKCCFCYNPVSSQQKFCSHCGNPPEGITCKNCGNHAHFDFCPRCDTPLSKRAAVSTDIMKNDPEIRALNELKASIGIVAPPSTAVPERPGDIDQLNDYLSRHSGEGQPKKPSFTLGGSSRDFSEEIKKADAGQAELAQNEAKAKEAALEAKVAALQARLFADNQSARLYYANIKIMLPQFKKCSVMLGWKCNYANFVHYDGPSGCACPNQGGRWICKDDVQWISADSFILDNNAYSPGRETPKAASPN